MIMILLIIVGGILFYVGVKPHEEFPRYAMMDEQTDGFGVLRINPEDQGVQEFTSFILNRLTQAHEARPETANQAKVLSGVRRISKNVLSNFIQSETMIYTSYDADSADENIIITAPLIRPIVWYPIREFIRSNIADEPIGKEGISEIYLLHQSDRGTSTLLSLDNNELAISDNYPLLQRSLGYARQSNRHVLPNADLQYFIDELALDQPPEGEDLAVAIVNDESRIINMIFVFEDFIGISGIADRIGSALAAQQLSFSDISGMKLTADLASADILKGTLTLYCPNSSTATRLATVFQSALPHITGDGVRGVFDVKGSVTGRDITVLINLEITGIKNWIEQIIPVPASPQAEPATTDDADTPASQE